MVLAAPDELEAAVLLRLRLRCRADGFHVSGGAIDCDHRRFVHHDAPATGKDQRIGRTQVDGEVRGQEAGNGT